MVWSLLNIEGLIYDLERHIIAGLKPRVDVLPVLALGLEATKVWEQRDGALWPREEFWLPPGMSPIRLFSPASITPFTTLLSVPSPP